MVCCFKEMTREWQDGHRADTGFRKGGRGTGGLGTVNLMKSKGPTITPWTDMVQELIQVAKRSLLCQGYTIKTFLFILFHMTVLSTL